MTSRTVDENKAGKHKIKICVVTAQALRLKQWETKRGENTYFRDGIKRVRLGFGVVVDGHID